MADAALRKDLTPEEYLAFERASEEKHEYADGEIFAGPIQKLFESVDQDTPATGLQARMVSIDIIDTIAAVRLELDDWNGHRYTDLLTLLKANGEWKIMNKVFHEHP